MASLRPGEPRTRSSGPPAEPSVGIGRHDPAGQAYRLLRSAFAVAPIAFGLDKFVGLLADWEQYLAPWVDGLVPGTAHQAMLLVGVVEIAAGILVALRPDLGGYVVAAWLGGIVGNLVTMGEYLDVALRDVGLLVAALALARLATAARPASRGDQQPSGEGA